MNRLQRLIREVDDVHTIVAADIKRMESVLRESPAGSIEVKKFDDGRRYQYYIRTIVDKVKKYKYLSKIHDWEMIQKLGDKYYAKIALRNLKKTLRGCKQFLKFVTPEVGARLANSVSRKGIPTTSTTHLPFEVVAEKWVNKRNHKAPRMRGFAEPTIKTMRGDCVRSKSEASIANILYAMNVPYKYEEALKLQSGKWIYPDFTILNPITGEECYYEHFGLMDDEEYAEKAYEKIDIYEQEGKVIGKTFLFTFETKRRPLSSTKVRKTIENMLNLAMGKNLY